MREMGYSLQQGTFVMETSCLTTCDVKERPYRNNLYKVYKVYAMSDVCEAM